MNIEKRKVTEAKPLPVAAKSALAATLGLTVASTFIACMGGCIDDTPTSIPDDPQPAPSSTTSNDEATPESSSATETLQSSSEQTPAQQSSSEQAETSQSSSSQMVVDIPLSHEHISSSVMEALSAAAESSSSDAASESSAVESTSSSSSPQTSSSSANNECIKAPGSDIIICPDQSLPHSSAMMSMVTTFERTDIEV